MLKALLYVRLSALKAWFTGALQQKKQQTKGRAVIFALLMVYVSVTFAVMFYGLFTTLSTAYYSAGLSWLYFDMFIIMDFALMFIGSVFTAKAQLFEARDNELLLSMPIPSRYILASRVSVLLIINFYFDLLVAVPAAIAWCMACPIKASSVVSFIVITLMLPLLAVAASSLFGWLISLLTRRVRSKTLITTLASLCFLAVYFFVINKAQTLIMQIAANGESIAARFSAVKPLLWMGKAVSDGNMLYLLLSVVCLVLPFLLAYWLLSATFIKTVSASKGAAKIAYNESRQKGSSVMSALYKRELKRFTSSSIYIMNAGLGAVFLVAVGVAVIVAKEKVLSLFSAAALPEEYLLPAAAAAICLLSSMSVISACSVSIEGKTHWVLRCLPVETRKITDAKLLVHISIICPAAFIASVGVAVAFKVTSPLLLLPLVLLPFLFSVLMGLIGLAANLRHPDFNWTNEAQAVKNGVSVIITMGLGLLAGLVLIGGGFLLIKLLSVWAALCILTVILAGVCCVIYSWINKKGTAIYERI